MKKELKRKIYGCIFLGAVYIGYFSVYEKYLLELEDNPDIIITDYSKQTPERDLYSVSVSASSSTMTATILPT